MPEMPSGASFALLLRCVALLKQSNLMMRDLEDPLSKMWRRKGGQFSSLEIIVWKRERRSLSLSFSL